MLCVIVISFKVHKAKEQKIKRKMFSLNKKGNTLYTQTGCHYQKKKKNWKEIPSVKPWPLEEEEELLSGSAGR